MNISECDDDEDNDDADDDCEDGDESNCQDISSSVGGVNDSASLSPQAVVDHSDADAEPDLESSKAKLPKSGLRIKLSLKPVRKSSREHKVPVSAPPCSSRGTHYWSL